MGSLEDAIDMHANSSAKIKVIGVGGGGGNAVQQMVEANLQGVELISANTDAQALEKNSASRKIQLGVELTQGLGAGTDPKVGREAALENANEIRDALLGANMVFITAGMGGGTGTGAAPVIAQIAKEAKALTVGVVTRPFDYEGNDRNRVAEEGINELINYVDSLIIIPNDRLITFAPKKTKFVELFKYANQVLLNAIQGISDIILHAGAINVDFADVCTVMKEQGMALMGTGRASGENRAQDATRQAILSPLLENTSLESARGILYNIMASSDLTGDEVIEIGNIIKEAAGSERNIKMVSGFVLDDSMGDELKVTVIATGIQPAAATEELEQIPAANISHFKTEVQTAVQRNQTPLNQINYQPVNMETPAPERIIRQPINQNWQVEADSIGHTSRIRANYGLARKHTPGKDLPIYVEDDLDVPIFLQSQPN